MAERTLRYTVHAGGTVYRSGTAESEIDAAHRELITNPKVWDDGDPAEPAAKQDGEGSKPPNAVTTETAGPTEGVVTEPEARGAAKRR